MAAVARAGPHRGVKDDEMVAHYVSAGEASSGVIRTPRLVEDVVVAPSRPCILRTRTDLSKQAFVTLIQAAASLNES